VSGHEARLGISLLTDADVTRLEQAIDEAEEPLPRSRFHLARRAARCGSAAPGPHRDRRAERRVLTLAAREPVRAALLAYLNRLADLLFVLARRALQENGGAAELPWALAACARDKPRFWATMPAVAIRKIAQLGEPFCVGCAHAQRRELKSPAIQTLIDDMIDTMHDADGAGLAAPQVYESVQLCVIEISKNPRYPDALEIPLTVLVNPVVTPAVASPPDALLPQDSIAMFEGCCR